MQHSKLNVGVESYCSQFLLVVNVIAQILRLSRNYFLIIIISFISFGCDSRIELIQKADESDTNKVFNLFSSFEIPIKKITNGDGTYLLTIDPDDSAVAFQIFGKIGLQEEKLRVPEIVVPGSSIDRILTDKILAGELEHLIERFPEVLSVKVMITSVDEFKNVSALIIRNKRLVWSELTENKISFLLKNSIKTVKEPYIIVSDALDFNKAINEYDQISSQFGLYAKQGNLWRTKLKLIFTFTTVFLLGLGCGVLLAYRRMAKKYGNIRRNN